MNTGPHICFVAPNAYPLLADRDDIEIIGGAELQQVTVARGLARRGYRVSMICLDFGQDDLTVIDGVKVFRAYRPDEGIPVLRFLWPRLTSIWHCLERTNADIYYQRTAGMLTGVVAAFANRKGRISVFAAAGNPDLEPNTPRIRLARDRRIYEYGLRNVDQILVQNQEQARLCRTHLGKPSTLVPNCYEANVKPLNPPGDTILWVSTIRALKRPHRFLDLAEALPQRRFRMIGGPAESETELYRSISERAANIRNLEFLGFVPFREVERHFNSAMIFVNTSESEGFPNTFLQSWSRRIPTVSFIDSGARWNGGTVGIVVDGMKSMVHAVKELVQDQAQYYSVGTLAYDYFMHHHSTDSILDIYEKVFAGLIEKRKFTAA